jgi:hypothetical protein
VWLGIGSVGLAQVFHGGVFEDLEALRKSHGDRYLEGGIGRLEYMVDIGIGVVQGHFEPLA